MPGARHAVGKPAIQWNAVEAGAFYAVVRGQGAQPYLHHPQGSDHEEILDRGALRRRGSQPSSGSRLGQEFFRDRPRLRGEVPDHAAHSGQQQNKADHAPHHRSACRLISDQRFVRPVLGVGHIVPGTIGGSGPRRPPEERAQLAEFMGIAQSVWLDRILVTPLAEYV